LIKRVLAIDGGGIKGAYAAAFLATVEDLIGIGIAERFDLIAGTSTGGIIAIGLGLGIPASRIADLYKRLSNDIFGGGRLLARMRQVGMAAYDSARLHDALVSEFGGRKLGESMTRLVVPSFDLEQGRIRLYKTAHHPDLMQDYKETAVQVAMATSAAPTYFPIHKSSSGTPVVDGAVWACNPSAVAAAESIGVLRWPAADIRLLNIGSPDETYCPPKSGYFGTGLLLWAPRIVRLFMRAQSSASIGIAKTLLGPERVTRFCPVVARGRYGFDDVTSLDRLLSLGAEDGRHASPELLDTFELLTPKLEFVPVHHL